MKDKYTAGAYYLLYRGAGILYATVLFMGYFIKIRGEYTHDT
jgi:hypothetical protein